MSKNFYIIVFCQSQGCFYLSFHQLLNSILKTNFKSAILLHKKQNNKNSKLNLMFASELSYYIDIFLKIHNMYYYE